MIGSIRNAKAELPVNLLRNLADMSVALGIDVGRLCNGLGFDVADLSNPQSRVSIRQASLMIKRALDMTKGRERSLGLDMSTHETIASMGLVGYAMLTSATLESAIALGISMQKHTGSLLNFEKIENPGSFSIRVSCSFHEPDIQTFLVEEAFGVFLNVARSLVGEEFTPASIELSYPKPAYLAQYEHLFKCPIRFDQTDNTFTFDARWASKPIATHDALSNRQVVELLQVSHPGESAESEFIESIERIVRRDLRHTVSLSSVASQLCMSDRTLRRRLAEYGLSYQSVLDDLRKIRALSLLNNSRLTLDEIAYEVGFSDARNFRRAFKRWTGHGVRQTAT
ncbi:AraC family transcriptional regulator [Pseudomonas yamanorum]|uniref:AraC family transcriptional regulator n=1 Tax=Pseudomonas yamanorum TaxID=515393 RepID=UPI001C46C133|nr:AraC family transcriptional regulator [Pseudomonas yamanorum]MBV6659762.1 AraC family transcriptional regulator [Pseudomonas yamanorum]